MIQANEGLGRSVGRGPGGHPSTPGSTATRENLALVRPPMTPDRAGRTAGRDEGSAARAILAAREGETSSLDALYDLRSILS